MPKQTSRIDLVLLSAIVGLLGGLLGTLVSELFILPRHVTPETPAFTRGGEGSALLADDINLRVGRGVVQWYGAKIAKTNPEQLRASHAIALGLVVTSDGWLLAPPGLGSAHVPVVDRQVLAVEKIARDPWTGLVFVKTKASDLTVSPWAPQSPRAGAHVFAPTRERGLTILTIQSVRGSPAEHDVFGSAMVVEGAELLPGAPIFDREGRVVGVYASARAIPSRHIIPAQNSLLKTGRVVRPDPGFLAQDVSLLPVPPHPRGALVISIRRSGPAERAGVKVGDIVLAVQDAPVDAQHDVFERLAEYAPGKEVRLEILRSGSKKMISLVLGEIKG